MKNTYKAILAVSALTFIVLALAMIKPSITTIVDLKEKTWSGEYMQVLVEPFNQTEALLGYGDYVGEEGVFGGMRPSNFKTTLARSLSATASTSEEIFVSSLTTKDAHTLDSSDIGDVVCMHINPGASNDEIVCCTGINTTNKSFTGCTRGYLFYSTSTTSGNAKAHSPGETMVISNDDHYLSTQYAQIDLATTITGLWTFGGDNIASIQFGSGNSTYDKRIYIYNGDVNKSYIGYDESENAWVISNNGVDTTTIGATGAGYSAGDGLLLTASDFDVAISSASGLYFIDDEYLGIYASTSNPLYIDDDGMVTLNASGSFTFGDLTLGTPLDETYGGLGTVSWDAGDMIYFSADNTAANIASGTEDYVLSMVSGFPGWITGTKYLNRFGGLNTQWTSSTTDTNLQNVASISIPANSIGVNGVIKIKVFIVGTNTATPAGIQVKLGESVIASVSEDTAGVDKADFEIVMYNKNSASAQTTRTSALNRTDSTMTFGEINTTVDTTVANELEFLWAQELYGTDTGTIDLINVEIQYSD